MLTVFATTGCADGLSVRQRAEGERPKAVSGALANLERGSESRAYPLNLPSTDKLRGRAAYTTNCQSCHGTYYTAAEKADLTKDLALPEGHIDKNKVVGPLTDEGRHPATPAKNGPDFLDRDWRFQRTPGQLFQLLAEGSAPEKLGLPGGRRLQHPGPVPGPDGRALKNPDGSLRMELGRGWINFMEISRGGVRYTPSDPVPVWDALFYVWSRSIAGHSVNRFKDVWDTYGQNCNVCHGTMGKGDGPAARTIYPAPFNFQNRKAMAETTDEFLYWRISEGGQFTKIPESIKKTMSAQALSLYVHQWSAMPAWRGVLTDDQRWMAVDGVRSKSYDHE
jgi:mono/diheme cytochrome c family protein